MYYRSEILDVVIQIFLIGTLNQYAPMFELTQVSDGFRIWNYQQNSHFLTLQIKQIIQLYFISLQNGKNKNMKQHFCEVPRDSTIQSIKNALDSTRYLRQIAYLSNYICEKLELDQKHEIISQAQALSHLYNLVKNEYEYMGLPFPNVHRKISIKLTEKLKKHQPNNQLKQNQERSALSVSSQQLTAIRQYAVNKFQLKQDFYQENIEASRSLKKVSSLQQMLDVIQKQGRQRDVCLGCLKELEQEMPMPETTQLYSLVNTKSINTQLEDNVKKKTCALLNGQGGYLFIGQSISKKQVRGLTLNEFEICQHREFVFKTIKKSIFPDTFEMRIDTIRTFKRDQIQKPIFRVSLRPGGRNGFYFVQKEVSLNTVFSCYFLDTNAIGEKNDVCVLAQTENIYKILAKHRDIKNTQQIVHKFGCVNRNNAMQNIFKKIDPLYQKNMHLLKLLDPGPVIKYRNQSILILPTEADDKELQLKKMNKNAFSKSYQLCRSSSLRSMWFISHQDNLPVFQSIITEVIANKQKTFTLITQKKQIAPQIKVFFKTFQSYFSQNPDIYGVLIDSPYEKYPFYDLYIKFDSFSKSYFTFMLLDDYRIRSKFIKQQKFKSIIKNKIFKHFTNENLFGQNI